MTDSASSPRSFAPTLLAVALASFLLPLAVTAPSAALPDIARALDASPTAAQWLVNGYAIAFASVVLAAGSVADRIGRRRVLRGGTALFAVASLAVAVAPSILVVDLLRPVQAIGAACILAAGAAVLAHGATGPLRATAFGVLGASFGSGLALGPVIAGLCAPLGWRAQFVLVALLAGVALASGARAAESRNPAAQRIDLPGMATFSVALLALSTAFVAAPGEGWTNPTTLGLLVAAAVLVAVFVIIELRRAAPMFDVRLFAQPRFVAVVCQPFTVTFGFAILLVFLPPYLERATGGTLLDASLLLLPLTVPVIAIPPFASTLVARIGIRGTLVSASVLIAAGTALLVLMRADGAAAGLVPGLLVAGLGVGAAFAVMDNAAVGAVAVERAGTASGMFNTMRLTGEAVAIAAGGAVLTSLTGARLGDGAHDTAAAAVQGRAGGAQAAEAVTHAFHVVGLGLAGLAVLGAAATWVALRPAAVEEGERERVLVAG